MKNFDVLNINEVGDISKDVAGVNKELANEDVDLKKDGCVDEDVKKDRVVDENVKKDMGVENGGAGILKVLEKEGVDKDEGWSSEHEDGGFEGERGVFEGEGGGFEGEDAGCEGKWNINTQYMAFRQSEEILCIVG